MERMTEKHYSGNGYYLKCSSECPNDGFCDDCENLFKAIDRLGEHEDKAEQKPKTNADRIRAMSDEELADWIARTQMGAIKDAMNLLRLPCDATDGVVELGKTEALEWLQQPAEGE